MIQKILVVEDEPHIADLISRTLREGGYDTYIASDGQLGMDIFRVVRPHLVVTDLIMPKVGGRELCRFIREQKSNVPIIMLTALGSTEDIVQGLDSGADDYMVKPFRVPELLARVRAMLRRAEQVETERISTLADLTLNHETKEVYRDKQLLELTATEFRLLEFLIQNKGKLKTRMEILEEVWGLHTDPGTNVVDVYINYLRNKMDKPFDQKLLHTKMGQGFILKG
jgi:DNA-binding response OmpR family regulator